MATLEQQQVDRSVLSQRLEMPQVDLPPEETLTLTQLVPEFDLIGEKSKDKKDDSDEEEVRGKWTAVSDPVETWLMVVVE